jgi:uncharacterized membrane protein YhhN
VELITLLPVVSLAVILSAGSTIVARYVHPPRPALIYIFKPLTTILILAAALLPGTFLSNPYARAISLGLVFSLFGDIWIMAPGDRFLYGLANFLLAHIFYIIAFLPGSSVDSFPWMAIPFMGIGAVILIYLWPALPSGLKGAVSVYVAVIVAMATLAASQAVARFSAGTLSAAVGALLFLLSDALLAIDRFRRPFHLAQAAILGTYFAGQLMIALSIGLLTFC